MALLSALTNFFEHGRWLLPGETRVEGQNLTAEDEFFVLMQAGLYLTATRGLQSPEALICHGRVEPLCHLLQWPRAPVFGTDRSVALYPYERQAECRATDHPTSLFSGPGAEQPRAIARGYRVLAVPLYFLGDFAAARQHARRGVKIWRSGGMQSPPEEVSAPVVTCLCYAAPSEWHLGEVGSFQATMTEAI